MDKYISYENNRLLFKLITVHWAVLHGIRTEKAVVSDIQPIDFLCCFNYNESYDAKHLI